MPVTRICRRCGREFQTKPSQKRKYCSMACYKKPIPIKTCPLCGKEFKGDHSRTKYCSARCSYDAKVRAKTKECPYCGKTFRKSAKFCCGYCYHQSKVGKPSGRERIVKKFVCETCGDIFIVYPSRIKHGNPRFCSDDCFYEWLNGSERAPRVNTKCETCGKKMRVLKSKYDVGQGRFCSQSCINVGREHPERRVKKVECECWHCGKTFYRYPSSLKRPGDGRFCSRGCSAAYYSVRNWTKRTKIEKMLMKELDSRNIGYKEQHPVTGWRIDIAFPSYKLAVEADGVYWHNLENVIEKDKRKDEDLQRHGWTVLRFTGDEIREDVSKCVDKIVAHLSS